MKQKLGMLIAGLILLAVSYFVGGRLLMPVSSLPDIRRAAGDSAVVAYRATVDDILGPLRDSVRYYKAKAVAAARVIVRYDSVTIHDTVRVVEKPKTDRVVMALPVVSQRGVTVTESLTVAPPPMLLFRATHINIDPDTVLLAIAETPDGLQRILAASSRGTAVVSEAGQTAPLGSRASEIVAMGGCVLAGYGIASGETLTIAAGGALCAALPVVRKWLKF